MNITHDNDPFGVNFDTEDKAKLFDKFVEIGNKLRKNEIPMDAVSIMYFEVYRDAVQYGFAPPAEKNVDKPLTFSEKSSNFEPSSGFVKALRWVAAVPLLFVAILLQPLRLLQTTIMKTTEKLIQSNNNTNGNSKTPV